MTDSATTIQNDTSVFFDDEGHFTTDSAEFASLVAAAPVQAKFKQVTAMTVKLDGLQNGAYIPYGVFFDAESKSWKLATYVADRSSDGTPIAVLETTRELVPGDVIVTNPPAFDNAVPNRYAMNGSTFAKKYEATDTPGVFLPKGIGRLVPNPTGQKIHYLAPWGELQTGDVDCYLCVVVDPLDPDNFLGETYIISAKDAENYAPIEEVHGANWREVIRAKA